MDIVDKYRLGSLYEYKCYHEVQIVYVLQLKLLNFYRLTSFFCMDNSASPSADSRRAFVSYWQLYVLLALINWPAQG